MRFERYFEPFAGGAAVFFAIQPSRAVVSDVNEDLVNAYRQIQSRGDQVLDLLDSWTNSESEYYRIRSSVPQSDLERAARLIYLCNLSFNGIYRVNRSGQFNVPYGGRSQIDPARVLRESRAMELLRGVELRCGDFVETTGDATSGDLLYFDPPYTLAHNNNGFIKYNERMFSWADQVRLAAYAKALVARGCSVVVSNADHSTVRELYEGMSIICLTRPSTISAASRFRQATNEILIVGVGQ